MIRYLLDTSALIDYAKGHEPVRSAVSALLLGSDDVGVSAVQVAEFFAGIPLDERAFWRRFFDDLAYWPMTFDTAVRGGTYRYEYARQGPALSAIDTLIASVAYAYNAILVTSNLKDFPMPEIRLLRLGQ